MNNENQWVIKTNEYLRPMNNENQWIMKANE